MENKKLKEKKVMTKDIKQIQEEKKQTIIYKTIPTYGINRIDLNQKIAYVKDKYGNIYR